MRKTWRPKTMLYKMDKTVLRVSGNAAAFLNGLTSNTLDLPHNAFLNVHGRIITTFDQVQSGPDEFLIVIFAGAWEALKAHTERFLRLNKTSLEPIEWNVYFDASGMHPVEEGDFVIPQRSGRMIVTPQFWVPTMSADAFTLFRLQHHIPLHGVDYHDEMVLNVHEYDFVSYTKGCFLGQEPIAKVHNRARPTWKLVVVSADDLPTEERSRMTSKILDPKTQRVQGFSFVPNREV